jgi:predicted transcriptional regulator
VAKTLTIRIKPVARAMRTFRDSFSALVQVRGKRPRPAAREEVFFSSIEAARKLLTPSRLALLRVIRTERPSSIYALARLVGRNLKNVQQDLRLLESYGLVRMEPTRQARSRRNPKVPEAVFDEIALKIAI